MPLVVALWSSAGSIGDEPAGGVLEVERLYLSSRRLLAIRTGVRAGSARTPTGLVIAEG